MLLLPCAGKIHHPINTGELGKNVRSGWEIRRKSVRSFDNPFQDNVIQPIRSANQNGISLVGPELQRPGNPQRIGTWLQLRELVSPFVISVDGGSDRRFGRDQLYADPFQGHTLGGTDYAE
jgi:hypothetical protein